MSYINRRPRNFKMITRNLLAELIIYEKVEVNPYLVRRLTPLFSKVIGLAKKGDLHAKRSALRYLDNRKDQLTNEKNLVSGHNLNLFTKLFTTLSERYQTRNGGYTRVNRIGFRRGDGSPLFVVSLV